MDAVSQRVCHPFADWKGARALSESLFSKWNCHLGASAPGRGIPDENVCRRLFQAPAPLQENPVQNQNFTKTGDAFLFSKELTT